jgi:4-hydroxybenzoate polyprenyltransferase
MERPPATSPVRESRVRSALALLRPLHWSKNLLVLAPVVFAGRLADPPSLRQACLMAASFCLLASGGYALNDLLDRERDRHHPKKRDRPLASGRLRAPAALALGVVCAAGGLLLAALVQRDAPPLAQHGPASVGPASWAALYLGLTLVYSAALKRVVVLDVLALASAFVLRAVAGAAALQLPPSRWLLVCSFFLALFLALGKRRTELAQLGAATRDSRPMFVPYRLPALDRLLVAAAFLAVGSYVLYTLADDTLAHVGSRRLLLTAPLVAWLVARHREQLRTARGGDPVAMLLGDRPVVAVFLLWCAAVLLIVYRP